MRRPVSRPTQTASLFGIFEGKRKRAKAEAAAKEAAAKAEADKKVIDAKAQAQKDGYKSEEQIKNETEALLAALDAQNNNNLYYIIGGIVVAVMIGLYFITRKH